MKKIFIPILFFAFIANSQTPCENGFAGEYPCEGIDLLSFLPNSLFGANRGNDCWGWTDTLTGREYALYGNSANTAFVDITDPVNPVYIGKLNSHSGTSIWRDIKVYKNHAFIVSEAKNHGMQVFDLTRLRNVDVDSMPMIFSEDAHDNSFNHAHNIAINEQTGYAYIVGANVYGGGPEFINIQDPKHPVAEGGFSDAGYTHDAEILVYEGPDTSYQGREIYFGANGYSVAIIDVTDKKNPVIISQFSYPLVRYTHQLWLDSTQRFLFVNDELDEQKYGNNTKNIVFDITDLDNPFLRTEYLGKTTAIDHNNYVLGDELYIANYRAGMRIIDIKNIDKSDSIISTMNEVAFFDTYPKNDFPRFDGAWSVYPFFKSGTIIISDINKGLFVVKKAENPNFVKEKKAENKILIYPNPVDNILSIESFHEEINTLELFDLLGDKVKFKSEGFGNKMMVDLSALNTGIYIINVNGKNLKFVKN